MTCYMRIKRILIAAALLCLLQLPGWTQTPILSVKGTVLTDKGVPVEGASVSISGSGKGAITDSKGIFTLRAPADAILVITYLGYATAHVPAQASIQVTLHPAGASLDEIVVIGYGTAKRKDLTGSLAVVTEKD